MTRTTRPTTPEERAEWQVVAEISAQHAPPLSAELKVLRLLEDIEEREKLLANAQWMLKVGWKGNTSDIVQQIEALLGPVALLAASGSTYHG